MLHCCHIAELEAHHPLAEKGLALTLHLCNTIRGRLKIVHAQARCSTEDVFAPFSEM